MEQKPNATKTYFSFFFLVFVHFGVIFFFVKDDYNVVKANAEKM